MAGCSTLSVKDAAKELGAPEATLARVAADLGLLIMFGNRKRIDPNDYKEIIDACRSKPKAPASISAKTPEFGSSVTRGAGKSQQALETAQKLKRLSGNTSQNATDPVVQLRQTQ